MGREDITFFVRFIVSLFVVFTVKLSVSFNFSFQWEEKAKKKQERFVSLKCGCIRVEV